MSLKTQECASKSTRLIWSQYSFYTLRKCFQNHRLSDGFKEYRKRTLAEKRLTQREDFFSNYSTFIFTFQLFWIYIKVYRRNFCALATWLKRAWEEIRGFYHPNIMFTAYHSRDKICSLNVEVVKKRNQFATDHYIKPTDTHQYLHASFCHAFHSKKWIPYSQTLRLNRICSENLFFD